MKRKLIIFPILVLMVCGIGTLILVKFGRKVVPVEVPAYKPIVEIREVKLEPRRLDVSSQGTVVAATRIALMSEVEGMVTTVSKAFQEGAVFRKGDVLIQIDPTDYQALLAQATSQVAAAQLKLDTIQAEADLARKDWQQMEDLKLGKPSPLMFQEPQFAEATATMASAKAALVKAEKDLARTTIRAPFDGRLLTKSVDLGQFIRRGQEVAQIIDVSKVEIRLPIPLSELAFLDPSIRSVSVEGLAAPIQVKLSGQVAGAMQQWNAEVRRTAGEIDPRSRMISLIAEVPDPFGLVETPSSKHARIPLNVGMFVKARILGIELPETFLVPRASILPDGRLIVLDAEDRIGFKDVTVIRFEGADAVIGAGLANGDRVCISSVELPVAGSQVEVHQPDNQVTP